MGLIKVYFIIIVSFFSANSIGQQTKFGLELTPSFQFQLLRNQSTRIRSSISGKGFSTGFVINHISENNKELITGLKVGFTAFNEKSGNYLLSSYRILSVNLPILFSEPIALSTNWKYLLGGGMNYHFSNRNFYFGNWVEINPSINQLQPYLAIGLSYIPTGQTNIQVDAFFQYNLVDNYKEFARTQTLTNTHLAAFNLGIKYFMNKDK